MKGYCFEVPPLSRSYIRAMADRFRAVLNWEEARFPVIEVLEVGLPRLSEDFVYEICSKNELDDDHGLTYPKEQIIKIREDVYDGACDGNGWNRFTIAHEMGHLILHSNISLARRPADTRVKTYKDSEWQADCFAGELLVNYKHARLCTSPDTMMEVFGVSRKAAETQWRVFRGEGIVQ